MDSEAFVRWAMDDARTVEERYCVELLIERCHGRWHAMHNLPWQFKWEKMHEHKRQRHLNPAYEPRYSAEILRRITEVFPEVTTWDSPSSYDDRVLRDFKALRFLPNLAQVTLDGEFSDLSPLLELRSLRKLLFHSKACEEYELIGRCTWLRELTLNFGVKWPDVKGLDQLTQLEVLELQGNLLAFEHSVTFPKVLRGSIKCEPLAARNVRDLPQLPACRLLTLSGVDRLDGIEAFCQLRNLRLECEVKDFAPLAALPELTSFITTAALPADVSPLVRVPRLAHAGFLFSYRWATNPPAPRDYCPLAESMSLRQLDVPDCPPVATEVAALNAAFPPWSDLFALDKPRPLPRLRVVSAPLEKLPRRDEIHLADGETLPIDEQLRSCESQWLARQIDRAIVARVGVKEWGTVTLQDYLTWARRLTINIECYELVEKFGEIFEAAREVLAGVKHDWRAHIYVDLKAPKLELTAEQKRLLDQFDKEQQEFDYEKRKKERDEFIDRLHRYHLKKQEGSPVDPAEFAAPAPLQPPPAPWEREDDADDEEDDASGEDVLTKKKPDPPPLCDDEEHPLADNYRMWGVLTLSELWLTGDAGLIQFTVGREPDQVIEREKK